MKDSTKYLKNMLSVYESKLTEKENVDPNTINNLESKVVHLAEENINLQVYIYIYIFFNLYHNLCFIIII